VHTYVHLRALSERFQ